MQSNSQVDKPKPNTDRMTKYNNKKYDSIPVTTLNSDYHTIQYDDFNSNYTDDDTTDIRYLIFKYIIEHNKAFYGKYKNKPIWIKYDSTIKSNNNIFNAVNISDRYDGDSFVYYLSMNYYHIKDFQSYIPLIKQAIDFIYSDKIKCKMILEHPHFNKGKKYFDTAIIAVDTMLEELELSFELLIVDNPFKHYTFEDFKEYSRMKPVVKNIIDNIDPADRKKQFQTRNNDLYYNILSLLLHCNFHQLVNNFKKITGKLQVNKYLYNLMINK